MALFGLTLTAVGTDNITGTLRFTFGILHLSDGFDLVPLVMGFFGISEVLINVEQTISQDVLKTRIKNLLPTAQDWMKAIGPILRGTGIGFFLGVLPGAGPVISSFVSYYGGKEDFPTSGKIRHGNDRRSGRPGVGQ